MNVTISCGGCADQKELHARLAAALDFPHWYGHNLDALMDCLTDVAETHVTLTGWRELPFAAEGFWETFVDASRENPRLTVTFG